MTGEVWHLFVEVLLTGLYAAAGIFLHRLGPMISDSPVALWMGNISSVCVFGRLVLPQVGRSMVSAISFWEFVSKLLIRTRARIEVERSNAQARINKARAKADSLGGGKGVPRSPGQQRGAPAPQPLLEGEEEA